MEELNPADNEDSHNGSGQQRRAVKRTPAQLEKKRAADREAQRVTRERTKNRIESLEKLVKSLSNAQHSPDCTTALRERDEARAELADVRSRLGSIIATLQPLTNPPNIAREQCVSNSYHKLAAGQSASGHNGEAGPYSTSSPASGIGCRVDTPHSEGSAMVPNSQAWASPQAASPAINTSSHRHNSMTGNIHMSLGRERNLGYDVPKPYPQERLTGQGWSNDDRHKLLAMDRMWEIQVANVAPTCPFDVVLIDFLFSRRRMLQQGATELAAAGPIEPNCAGLIGLPIDAEKHPVARLLSDIVTRFECLTDLPVKAAHLYIMFIYLRWQISPTMENYNRLPDWLRPLPSQLKWPHPAWMDYVFWPSMRDVMTKNHLAYHQDDIVIPWTQSVRVNWSYDPDKVILPNPQTDEMFLNPVFEQHLHRLSNWSLGPRFSQAFPSLSGTYRMVREADTGKEAGWEYSGS